MWFRIQSEGFITAAQTGGDIPPNWGHQSSCCCVLSSVQIASFFFFKFIHFPFSPFSFPSLFLSLSLAPYRWDLLSLAVGYTPPPLVCISSGGTVQEQPHVTVRQREMGRGELEPEPSHAVDASSRRRISTSGAVFFPMSTSVSLTGLI